MRKPRTPKKPKAPKVFVDDLSPLAQRAVEACKKAYRSTGWMFSPRTFDKDPEVLERFRDVAEELTRAGYLDKTVSLVVRDGPWDDEQEVELNAEDGAEAEKCLGTKDTFVRPDTGDELLLVPGDLRVWYITTRKMPVAPLPPDERAVAAYRSLRETRNRQRDEACIALQAGNTARWDQLVELQKAQDDAMELVARLFELPYEVTGVVRTGPGPQRSAGAASPPTPGS